MKENKTKKEIITQYKKQENIGGVYIIKNILNNKIYLDAAINLPSRKNRFEFSKQTGICVEARLQSDWSNKGSSQFVFKVLEEFKKRNADYGRVYS